MPTPVKINSTKVITPLFDMEHKETLHSYRKGVHCQSQHGCLYPMRKLVSFLQWTARTNFFDKEPAADIYRFVGYEFGFIHGGILTPEKTLCPDVTALVAFDDNQDAIQGYRAGRRWFFKEATPDERSMTDDQLIELLHELTNEAPTWDDDPEGIWFYVVGNLLGELSGNLFPLTEQERQQWQAEAEAAMKAYLAAHEPLQESQVQDTELLAPVPVLVVEYTA